MQEPNHVLKSWNWNWKEKVKTFRHLKVTRVQQDGDMQVLLLFCFTHRSVIDEPVMGWVIGAD